MKKLVFIFFALFFATIITGCNARENTVRFDTNIVDDGSDKGTTEEATTDGEQEKTATEENTETTSEAADEANNNAATDPVENTDNLPHVGSSAWVAFIISLAISGSYVIVQKLRKFRA